MVISMPTDGDSKAVCAAVWHQDPSQMHLPALLPPQPAIAGSSGRSFLRRRRRMTKVMGFLIMLIFAILLGLRAPNLLTTEHQQENEDKRVHVYTLYPKFTTVPIKMTQIRRTLLERDLSRLGKSSVGNHSVRFHVGGNIYPDGYL